MSRKEDGVGGSGSSPENDALERGVSVGGERPQLLARWRSVGGHCLLVSHADPGVSVNNPRGY
jgi:hypothetical protein